MDLEQALPICQMMANVYAKKLKTLDAAELYSVCIAKLPHVLGKLDKHNNPKAYVRTSMAGYMLNYYRDHCIGMSVPRKFKDTYMWFNKLKKRYPYLDDDQVLEHMPGVTDKLLQDSLQALAINYCRLDAYDNHERKTANYDTYCETAEWLLALFTELDDKELAMAQTYWALNSRAEREEAAMEHGWSLAEMQFVALRAKAKAIKLSKHQPPILEFD